MSKLLEVKNLSKSYHRGNAEIAVLKGVNLMVDTNEMTAIVGASGSGKTTLLQILGTLDSAESGSLLFKGRNLGRYSESELAQHRNNNIGFIFQFHHLLPEFSALENIIMPGLINGKDKNLLEENAIELLKKIDLEHRATHRSGELSGGEQQRIALARALIMEPSLLLADEPTGNLDSASGNIVFSLLKELSDSMGLSVLMVTHNMDLANQLDRCLTLKDGLLN